MNPTAIAQQSQERTVLIGFIGSPCSGKTTTAARLFADLKDFGYVAEFVPEQARLYIAHQRQLTSETVTLTDADQFQILKSQRSAEELMLHGDTIVVTDSSILNTLLYLSSEFQSESFLKEVDVAARRYDLLFRCPPVQTTAICDPNRVHSFAQSVELHGRLDQLLAARNVTSIPLGGSTRQRASAAMSLVLERLCR